MCLDRGSIPLSSTFALRSLVVGGFALLSLGVGGFAPYPATLFSSGASVDAVHKFLYPPKPWRRRVRPPKPCRRRVRPSPCNLIFPSSFSGLYPPKPCRRRVRPPKPWRRRAMPPVPWSFESLFSFALNNRPAVFSALIIVFSPLPSFNLIIA